MKALFAAAVAAALAFPAFAQKSELPDAKERAQNREAVQQSLPSAEERAKNREAVSRTAASATLTTKVKSALAADVSLKTVTSINVDSEDGVVTLKGKVASNDQKERAAEVAKKVDGVKAVKNELAVEKS